MVNQRIRLDKKVLGLSPVNSGPLVKMGGERGERRMAKLVKAYCGQLLTVAIWDRNNIKDQTRPIGQCMKIDRLDLVPESCSQGEVKGYLFNDRIVVKAERNRLVVAEMCERDMIEVDDLEGCMVFIGEGTRNGKQVTLVGHVENTEYFEWLLNILRWEQRSNKVLLSRGSVYFLSAKGDQEAIQLASDRRGKVMQLLEAESLSFPIQHYTYELEFGKAELAEEQNVNRAVFLVTQDGLAIVSYFSRGRYQPSPKSLSDVSFQMYIDSGEPHFGIRVQNMEIRS